MNESNLIQREGTLLRIYLSERDQFEGRCLYEVLIEAARGHGLAGATAFRGMMGFGVHQALHTEKILQLSTDLPVVVEILDSAPLVHDFLQQVRPMVKHHCFIELPIIIHVPE